MTDTNTDTPTTDAESTATTDARTDRHDRVKQVLNYLLLAGLGLFGLVAAVGLYTAISSAITTWVTSEYRPLARAAFNLVLLVLVAAAVSVQVRRIR